MPYQRFAQLLAAVLVGVHFDSVSLAFAVFFALDAVIQ
jgi:hypothetical protein